jgi:hypothetical protein
MQPDMFTRSLAAFTDALGVDHAASIITLSLIPWSSDDERNTFIKDITGRDFAKENAYGSQG